MGDIHVPVLIVGAGGCGLSSSIFLSELGTKSLLVERHASSGRLPKARFLNQRAMEIYRQFGVADEIYRRSIPLEAISRVRYCTSLAGDGPLDRRTFFVMDSLGGGSLTAYHTDSPCDGTLYPQVRLEPLLSAEAEKRNPGGVRYQHELVGLVNGKDGVRAEVRDLASGESFSVTADYLIAADGGRSVGTMVGVRMEGVRDLVEMVTVYFRADLSQWWHDEKAITTWFVNPDGGSWLSGVLGKLGPTRFDGHSEEWMFHFSFRPDDPARFDESALVPRMRELLKLPDLDPQVIAIGHWVVEAVLADRFRFGRVFLAGDAAHRHPPTTGLGLNSAIQDAHNLCWKIAAVVKGHAGDSLLDSYEAERRPVVQRNVDWTLLTFQNHQLTDAAIGLVRGNPEASRANFAALFAENEAGRTRRARLRDVMSIHRMEWQAHDLEIGYAYEYGALVPDGTLAPERDPMGSRYVPTTRPGHRLPHAWIERAGKRLSTHDLGEPHKFLLIVGDGGAQWRDAAQKLQSEGFPLAVASIEEADCIEQRWTHLREVGTAGAVLARPDRHIGWRSFGMKADAEAVLRDALMKILARYS